ncbi:MAG: trypsin-like serine protease, partial [Planctomycetota bacterium]
ATSGGTLIHPEWVITAAHCANANTEFRLGETRANFDVSVPVAERFRHPEYSNTSDVTSGHDLALMRLDAPILDVTPVRMYRLLSGELTRTATVVGYGRFGTGLSGDNMGGTAVRRAGQNVMDIYGSFVGASNQIVLTDFDNPNDPSDNSIGAGSATPLDFENGISLYDSGSGWFVEIDGRTHLAAVTSFRTATTADGNINSDYGDIFGGTRVSREMTWIDSAHDQSVFFRPTQTGDWHTATAWETNLAPGAANAAVIDGGNVTITQDDAEAKYLFLVGDGQLTLANTLATNNLLLREQATLGIDVASGPAVVMGEYAQSGGTLSIDLGGTTVGDYDQLSVSGHADLGGDLSVAPNADFGSNATRGQMDNFTILTATTLADEFDTATFNGETLDETMSYVGEAGDGRDGMFASIRYVANTVQVDSYFALEGDANGDGNVDGQDFVIWNTYKFTDGTDWSTGDFNNDGRTDGQDFVVWNTNKFTSVADAIVTFPTVPEPQLALWMLIPAFWIWRRAQSGRRSR